MTCEECTTSQLAAYKLTKAEQLTKTSTHKLTNSSTYQLKTLNLHLLFYNIVLIFAPF